MHRRTEAPDHVRARIVLFRDDARADDAGRVADPGDFDIGIHGLECLLVRPELVGFERGVHGEPGLLRERRARDHRRHGNGRRTRDQAAEYRFEHCVSSSGSDVDLSRVGRACRRPVSPTAIPPETDEAVKGIGDGNANRRRPVESSTKAPCKRRGPVFGRRHAHVSVALRCSMTASRLGRRVGGIRGGSGMIRRRRIGGSGREWIRPNPV